ncbi:hypothetical protein SteCoe_16357 [Stentor coeruleus]|uniref:Sugar phosphate transporter domain-containing protein n=1 Tax=Stentor coeruleus TaxID=5963 RepID=A0A1R2C1B8_9CILI|nr:hypothetical protein SteCoe_16357 [Stentor coeruleus]
MDSKRIHLSPKLEFLISIAGIYTSYIYFGILQEHIYTNPNRKPFKHPEFVVLCQMFLGTIVSYISILYIVSKIFNEKQKSTLPTKLAVYYGVAFSYSMFLTNFSLTLVSYPTQALAKSCKILPTLLGSIFVKDVHYHPLQYLSVFMITTGVIIFNWKGQGFGNDSILGLTMLLGSLSLDSLTSYYAEHIRRNTNLTSLQIMNYCCKWGFIAIFPIVLLIDLFSEETILSYLINYPGIMIDIISFGFASAIGQIFIFWALKISGSLTLSIITTIRKFLTVLMSILWFSHKLNEMQWICMALVFSGTLLDMLVSHKIGKPKHKDN